MKSPKLSTDVVPIAEFKGKASQWLRRLRETAEPVVITHNGKPAAVMLSPGEYDRLSAHVQFLEPVAAGLADSEAGRTMTTAQMKKRFKARRSG